MAINIVKSSFVIESSIKEGEILEFIERIGRTAYKSESRITKGSAQKFIRMLIERGHLSVLEHYSITVRVICDRGVSHEIVRHRLASYTQESTRYCNYSKEKFGGNITVIEPSFWAKEDERYKIWETSMMQISNAYNKLIELGATPQEARSILPNSLKTEIVMTMNIREWIHFFRMRTSKAAHPQMREIAISLYETFKKNMPTIFGEL